MDMRNIIMKGRMKDTDTLFASPSLTERQSSVLHLSSTAYGLLRKISVRISLRQRFAGPSIYTPFNNFPTSAHFLCMF